MFARLLSHEQLPTGFIDSSLDHQVIAHREVFSRVAQFTPVGFAGSVPIAPAVQGESEGGFAMGSLKTDGAAEFYPAWMCKTKK